MDEGSRPLWQNKETWLFPESFFQELTPNRRENGTVSYESEAIQYLCVFTQDLGQKCNVNQLCVNTTVVYVRRVFTQISLKRVNRHDICAVCLFLAAKIEEQPRKLEFIINAKMRLCHSSRTESCKPSAAELAKMVEEYKTVENVVLRILGFDLTVEHPHQYIVRSCNVFKASKEFAQTAYFLATNSLHLTNMCVMYPPSTVACICINMALKWARQDIPASLEGKEWFEYIQEGIKYEDIKRMSENIIQEIQNAPEALKRNLPTFGNKSSRDRSPQKRPAPAGHAFKSVDDATVAPGDAKRRRVEFGAETTGQSKLGAGQSSHVHGSGVQRVSVSGGHLLSAKPGVACADGIPSETFVDGLGGGAVASQAGGLVYGHKADTCVHEKAVAGATTVDRHRISLADYKGRQEQHSHKLVGPVGLSRDSQPPHRRPVEHGSSGKSTLDYGVITACHPPPPPPLHLYSGQVESVQFSADVVPAPTGSGVRCAVDNLSSHHLHSVDRTADLSGQATSSSDPSDGNNYIRPVPASFCSTGVSWSNDSLAAVPEWVMHGGKPFHDATPECRRLSMLHDFAVEPLDRSIPAGQSSELSDVLLKHARVMFDDSMGVSQPEQEAELFTDLLTRLHPVETKDCLWPHHSSHASRCNSSQITPTGSVGIHCSSSCKPELKMKLKMVNSGNDQRVECAWGDGSQPSQGSAMVKAPSSQKESGIKVRLSLGTSEAVTVSNDDHKHQPKSVAKQRERHHKEKSRSSSAHKSVSSLNNAHIVAAHHRQASHQILIGGKNISSSSHSRSKHPSHRSSHGSWDGPTHDTSGLLQSIGDALADVSGVASCRWLSSVDSTGGVCATRPPKAHTAVPPVGALGTVHMSVREHKSKNVVTTGEKGFEQRHLPGSFASCPPLHHDNRPPLPPSDAPPRPPSPPPIA